MTARIRRGAQGPRPYGIRLDQHRHDPAVVQAILAIGTEYPGDRPIAFLVGQRMLTVPQVSVDPHADGFVEAIRRTLRAYERPH